mmetsp:Transcript_27220/g.54485  ORF Transcript_27220/g.54485 Transcript_27220/m.54485 type:complete len:93 (+) Transcript_27220:62-340(+)
MGKGEAHLCSSDGFTNQVRNGGVCVRHGAKRKRWSNDGYTNSAEIRGVCMGQRANYAAVMDVQIKSIREECVRHGAKHKLCSSDGSPKHHHV